MKKISENRRKRILEASPVRAALLAKHKECLICGHSPAFPWFNMPRECSQLCVHEIACGVHREKALDKPYACLVLCWHCNGSVVTNKGIWPEARQLAVLLEAAPEDYDLPAYNFLVNPRAPNRIEHWEVERWTSPTMPSSATDSGSEPA